MSLIGCCALSTARAQSCNGCSTSSQSFSCSLPLEIPVAGTRQCELPSFDTTLGTLTSVTVDVTLLVQDGRFRMENLDPDHGCPGNSSPIAWFVAADAAAFEPSSTAAACVHSQQCNGAIPPLPPFDGTIDFGVTTGGDCTEPVCASGSGNTQNCANQPPLECASICITEPSRLAVYASAGPGLVPFTLQSVIGSSAQTGCGKVITTLRMRVGATFGVTYHYVPTLETTTFCFGDGSLATPCPCAPPDVVPNPSGAPGAGCANSFSLDGASLLGLGTLAPDELRLSCSIGPSYIGFGFLVKGDGVNAAGVASGDGVRCVDGALIRFGGHNAGAFGAGTGCWSYPNTAQTTPVTVATAQPAGQTARYQLVYRNAAAGFCSPATINVSNGVQATWP